MARVGFLGLGTMGFHMAMRLVDAGHDVVVWNRSQEPIERALEQGARRAESPEEALNAPVSFSMFANDAVADAILSDDALAAAGNGVHANMASVSPACATRLAERAAAHGSHYVGSPVLGRPQVAQAGELNILAAGSPDAISQLHPYFDVMGKKTWTLGENPATANLVKIAVNYNIIHAIQALAESVALAEAHGVPAKDFTDLLSQTLFGGVVYSGYGTLIAEREYTPQAFSLELGRKDLSLARSAAAEMGVTLPTAPVLDDLFAQALATPDLIDLDWSALAEITRRVP